MTAFQVPSCHWLLIQRAILWANARHKTEVDLQPTSVYILSFCYFLSRYLVFKHWVFRKTLQFPWICFWTLTSRIVKEPVECWVQGGDWISCVSQALGWCFMGKKTYTMHHCFISCKKIFMVLLAGLDSNCMTVLATRVLGQGSVIAHIKQTSAHVIDHGLAFCNGLSFLKKKKSALT